MKALTIRQPWASLIALGVKTIETRAWSTRYRGPLAIHAGLSGVPRGWEAGGWVTSRYADGSSRVWKPAPVVEESHWLHYGVVVAVVDLIDVVPMVDQCEPGAFPADAPEGSGLLSIYGDRANLWRHEPDGLVLSWRCRRRADDDMPFGDFTPGRFAWLLDNVRPLDVPVPAKGKQGLWTWEDR